MAVDPQNEAVLLAGDVDLYRSSNGGGAWTLVGHGNNWRTRLHEDLHAIVFDPANHDHVFAATDSGVWESVDNGRNWRAFHQVDPPPVATGLVTAQCWTVGVSQVTGQCAVTTHDNFCYASAGGTSFTYLAYSKRGEGGFVDYDPRDANVIYVDNWVNDLVKTVNGQDPWNQQIWTSLGIEADNLNARALAIAWNDTNRLLAVKKDGTVARSTNGGQAWATTLSAQGIEISVAKFAPSDDAHAYAASTSGRVWHSIDGGATWTELARVGLPGARVHDIEVDWTDPLRVYLAFGTRGALGSVGFRQMWRGEIGAGTQATWFDITGAVGPISLPDLGLTGLVLDPLFEDVLYVSTILGVYRSINGGNEWFPFNDGLPNCFVSDLQIRRGDRTLYAATMGRGVYRRSL